MILLIAASGDVQADGIEPILEAMDIEYLRLNPTPLGAPHLNRDGLRGTLTVAGSTSDLSEVSAVWLSGSGIASSITDVWEALDAPGVTHLPASRSGVQRAQGRLRQLQVATELGFEVYDPEEPVPAPVHVRVVVVGNQVFTARPRTKGAEDWLYGDQQAAYGVYQLPDAIAETCGRLVSRLGLGFGIVDLVLTPYGKPAFVALDPVGEYGSIELATGMPISFAVAELLGAAERRQKSRRLVGATA